MGIVIRSVKMRLVSKLIAYLLLLSPVNGSTVVPCIDRICSDATTQAGTTPVTNPVEATKKTAGSLFLSQIGKEIIERTALTAPTRGFNLFEPAKELATAIGSLIDVDECNATQPRCLNQINTKCTNTLLGYYCSCKPGYSEVTDMDGTVMFCGKPILLTQTFGLPYKSEYANRSSTTFLEFAKNISSMITGTYVDNRAIVTVRKITNGSVIVTYETTPLDQIGGIFDLEMLRSYFDIAVIHGYGYGNITVSPPTPAKIVACFPAKVRSHVLIHQNIRWTFGESKPGRWVLSEETCMNSNIGYVASIPCKIRNESGLITGYYDPNALEETFCQKDPRAALASIGLENVTNQGLPDVMATLAVISSTLNDSSTSDLHEYVSVYDEIARDTMVKEMEVSEYAMNSIIWAADNLHDTLMMRTPDVLGDWEKTSFIDSLDIFANNLVFAGEEVQIEGRSLNLKATNIHEATNEITFTKSMGESVEGIQPLISAHLPVSSLKNVPMLNSTKAIFLLYTDSLLFPNATEANTEISEVLSVQISNTDLANMAVPINITFPPNERSVEVTQVNACNYTMKRCSFLNITSMRWEYSGCETRSAKMPGYTSCSCNHATNFAVLVQTHNLKSSYALTIVGKIGCSLSLVGLILTMIIYLSFRPLRVKTLNQIHINLCASLSVGYLTFLIAVERPRHYAPCMAVTAILQFSFLSSWGWMVTEFYVMYRKFVHVFADIHGAFVLRACAVVYVGSLIVAAVTFIIAYVMGDLPAVQLGWLSSAGNDSMCWKSHYAGDRLCWLHSHSLYFGFLVPVGIMFFINFVGCFVILNKINQKRPNLGQSNKNDPELKDQVKRIFTISSMLGVTWIFAIPLTISEDRLVNEIFSWLFSLGNAFQGLTFFILYCVRQDYVRNFWTGYFFVYFQRNKDGTKPLHVTTVTMERATSTNDSTDNKITTGDLQMENLYDTSNFSLPTIVTT